MHVKSWINIFGLLFFWSIYGHSDEFKEAEEECFDEPDISVMFGVLMQELKMMKPDGHELIEKFGYQYAFIDKAVENKNTVSFEWLLARLSIIDFIRLENETHQLKSFLYPSSESYHLFVHDRILQELKNTVVKGQSESAAAVREIVLTHMYSAFIDNSNSVDISRVEFDSAVKRQAIKWHLIASSSSDQMAALCQIVAGRDDDSNICALQSPLFSQLNGGGLCDDTALSYFLRENYRNYLPISDEIPSIETRNLNLQTLAMMSDSDAKKLLERLTLRFIDDATKLDEILSVLLLSIILNNTEEDGLTVIVSMSGILNN